MKKLLLFSIAVFALLLSSCDNDEFVEEPLVKDTPMPKTIRQEPLFTDSIK